MIYIDPPLKGGMDDLYRTVVKLSSNTLDWIAGESKIISKYKKIRKLQGFRETDEITKLLLDELVSQGYIYKVDEKSYTILKGLKVIKPKITLEEFRRLFDNDDIRKLFDTLLNDVKKIDKEINVSFRDEYAFFHFNHELFLRVQNHKKSFSVDLSYWFYEATAPDTYEYFSLTFRSDNRKQYKMVLEELEKSIDYLKEERKHEQYGKHLLE